MKIGQINLNNSICFKGRKKKKSASFSVSYQSENHPQKIELQVSRSDYRILPTGDLKCNHYREGKQIENSNFCESVAITPIDSNEDRNYNPSCDYSCESSSDDSLAQVNLSSSDIKAYADLLSEQILNYALINKDLLCDPDCQDYFYSLLNKDFLILDDKTKSIILKYISLDNITRGKKYESYRENLSQNLINKDNKVFYNYCTKQKKISLAKANGLFYDNEDIILKKISEHKDEIDYLWTNIATITSMFKGTFNNFIDISKLPCCCCGIALNDDVSVEHIRPHSIGKKLTKNKPQNKTTQTVDRKFNSPRNFIFEHQACNGKRGNTEFKTYINSISENFGQNTIDNINAIVNLIKSNKKLSESLRSYGNFIKYNLNEILFYFENKPKLMKELFTGLNNENDNKPFNKDSILNQINNIISKYNIKNMRLINSLKRDVEIFANKKEKTMTDFKAYYSELIETEEKLSQKPVLEEIKAILNSKILDKVMTKEELEDMLLNRIDLSDENHSPFIKEIRYLYNQYCILKYYPPVISKTVYRETGGEINIGLSSWANLMHEIEKIQKPKEKEAEKISFAKKYIKPIGHYFKSIFSQNSSRVLRLPRS